MTTPAFEVTVQIGSWSQTLTNGSRLVDGVDVELVANDAGVVMDGLRASWDMPEGFPSQPGPTVCSFELWIPHGAAAAPAVEQGTHVAVTITPPGFTAEGAYAPVLDFRGRLTDADAAPLDDGLAFRCAAVDYLADLNEERLGDDPWPEETMTARLQRIVAASGLRIEFDSTDPAWSSSQGSVAFLARDVDSQPTGDLIEQHLRCIALWQGLAPWSHITIGTAYDGRGQYYANPPGQYWLRPYIVPAVNIEAATPDVSYRLVYMSDRNSSDAALPYKLVDVAGQLQLRPRVLDGELPADSDVCWVPAGAIVRDSISWRQDKRTTVNRVRLTGTFVNPDNVAKTIGSSAAKYPDLIAANGPVEQTVDAALIGNAGRNGGYLGPALLGARYDAQPRYTFDSIAVDVRGIADGRLWPRFFQQRDQLATDYFAGAAGRLVFVHGIDDRWNLTHRPETWGQLVGAQLELAGSRLLVTGQLVHRRPAVNGPSSAGTFGGTLSSADVKTLYPTRRVLDVAPDVTFADLRLTT